MAIEQTGLPPLPNPGHRRARHRQTLAELDRLNAEITGKLIHFREILGPKYSSRLAVLEKTLATGLRLLRSEFCVQTRAQNNSQGFYGVCRRFDLGVLWVRSLWNFFRTKLAQHHDEEGNRCGVLAAADEIIWACYAPVFRALGCPEPAPPLPYFEPMFSPRAIPLDEPPAEFRMSQSEFLHTFARALPVAVIGIPEVCRAAPWLLATIPHEVGHHVQHELNLVQSFADELASSITAAKGGQEPHHDRWKVWGQEVFADGFAMQGIGAAACRTLAEFELSAASLSEYSPKYPPAIIRLDCMCEALPLPVTDGASERLVGREMARALESIRQTPAVGPLAAHLGLVKIVGRAVPQAVMGSHRRLGQPVRICDLFEQGQSPGNMEKAIDDAKRAMTTDENLDALNNPLTIRRLTTAVVRAWDEAADVEDDNAREQRLKKLGERFVKLVVDHAEPGYRSGPGGARLDYGEQLASLLLQELQRA